MTEVQEDRRDAEHVISTRSGDVLIKRTILKADHFPGCQNKKLYPNIDGAPNFRKVEGLPVYGVAVPTTVGLRIVLDLLGADQGKRKVLWHNMREEPLLYVNGKPYVVRDADRPFANLEYTGIDHTHVEEMEERLKQDALREAELYGGLLLLAGERDNFEVVEFWESVEPASIQTPQEVFAHMMEVGYDVNYLRVPVTDEKAPKERDCELLIQRCWDPPAGAALIFNCQMGRGRTTSGMIIASLLQLRLMGAFPTGQSGSSDDIPAWFTLTSNESQEQCPDSHLLKSGMYSVVRSLLRMMSRGKKGKQILDLVIDACSAMQNLREAILTYRDRMVSEANERKRSDLLRICLEYLERYCVLLALTSYLSHPRFNPRSPNFLGFRKFMEKREEFKSVLERMLRRNPLSALQLRRPTNLNASLSDATETNGYTVLDIDRDPINQLIAGRSGDVLLQYTILKEDHFPSMHKDHLTHFIEGAPNFRQTPGLPVCGVALPTVEGIREVLNHVKAGPTHDQQVTAVWHNMREEPVVYINGRPFVLREEARPFKNLREYAGIEPKRLQQMENRLKVDILEEAKLHEGRILVGREMPSGNLHGYLEYSWEKIAEDSNVLTPAQVYSSLQAEGYSVNYHRLPVTEGTPPGIKDFDTLIGNIRNVDHDSPLIFNCHNGMGRSTIGMIIGSLFRLKAQQSSLWETVSNYSQNFDEALSEGIRHGESEESDSDLADAAAVDLDTDVVDPQERAAGEEGDYLAVRRLVLLLDGGSDSKLAVDKVIDACGLLVNLRTAIMQYRKPPRAHSRPETQNRDTFFKWSVAYLERYCLLIAFSSYLDHTDSGLTATFKEWTEEHAEVRHVLGWIRHNPGASLSMQHAQASQGALRCSDEHGKLNNEEQRVFAQRKGSVLTKTTILKTYHMAGYITRTSSTLVGLPALYSVGHLPIYATGNLTVDGIHRLLHHFEADPAGDSHVAIIDVRAELVVYIGGSPYLRRDLVMPVTSLKHAGVAAEKLQQLEESLRDDVQNEARKWGNRILVHKEVENPGLNQSWKASSDKDVTIPTEDPVACVVGLWKNADVANGSDGSICTPQDIIQQLVDAGYKVSYSRVPLAREQIPKAKDLDLLQLCIDAHSGTKQVNYLLLSRTAKSSSIRFVASFLACHLVWSAPGGSMISSDVGDVDIYSSDSKDKLALGEFRGIMNLCRVLPKGIEHKRSVDQAIDQCHLIGSLREDIQMCKYSETNVEGELTANLFGLHYLQRYFLLIAYRCYLDNREHVSEPCSEWMAKRKELIHLLKKLSLE